MYDVPILGVLKSTVKQRQYGKYGTLIDSGVRPRNAVGPLYESTVCKLLPKCWEYRISSI